MIFKIFRTEYKPYLLVVSLCLTVCTAAAAALGIAGLYGSDARAAELAGVNLLLQPMTQAAFLRRWLCANGFAIRRERCAVAAGKAYAVIQAGFTGEEIPCTPLYALTGRAPEDEGPDAGAYLKALLEREEKRLRGLNASASPDPEALREAAELVCGLKGILRARGKDGKV